MGNFNTSAFQYAGQRYSFTALLSWDRSNPNSSIAFDNNHIDSFVWSNQINSLFINGYLEYTDTRGEVDKVYDKQFAYIEINFYQIEVESDGDYVNETPSKTHNLYQLFYINSVEILDRHENEVKYRFNFVSRNWFQCHANVDFSNYDDEKQDIVDIIKAILKNCNLAYNPNTFDIVKSGVKLNFITDRNDNAVTSIGYLLNKMYYYHDRISQLQFLIYNEHNDQYEMFDVMNPNTWFSMTEMPVTFYSNQIEQFTTPNGVNFASVVKFPRTKTHTMINNAKYYDFDIEKNRIIDETIENKTIQNVYNTFYNTGEYDANIQGLYKDSTFDLKYNRYSSYWNNLNNNLDINLYEEMICNLTGSNALVVNTVGNILRKPGCLLNISIDRDVKNDTGSDDVTQTQNMLDQYLAYEGRWFVTKVQNFLNLREFKYTQNIICCRNFLKKSGTYKS